MRWQQGQWSEERILAAINASEQFWALPYGRSGVGPTDRERMDAYWEDYSSIESVGKRPDLLVITRDDYEDKRELIDRLGDTTLRTDEELAEILSSAVCGIEAENSLWVGASMPDFGTDKITRLNFVAPTVIVKDEDAPSLVDWQSYHGIPICVAHAFFDQAFIIELDDILSKVERVRELERQLTAQGKTEKEVRKESQTLQKKQGVLLTEQSYNDARTGTGPKKLIFRTHYTRARKFGSIDPDDQPNPRPQVMTEPNGKIIPFVAFEGGSLLIDDEALDLFRTLASRPV